MAEYVPDLHREGTNEENDDIGYTIDHFKVRSAWNRVCLLESGVIAPVPIRATMQQNSFQERNMSLGMCEPQPQERTGKSYWETFSPTDHPMYAIGQVDTPVSLQHISEPIAQISTNAAYSFHADSRGSTMPHDMARKLKYEARKIGNVAGMCEPPPQERTGKSYCETLSSTDHAMYAIGQTPVPPQHISEPIAQISTNAAYSIHADSRGSTMPHGMARKLSYEARGRGNVAGMCEPPPQERTRKSYWETLNSTDHAMYAIGQTPVSLQHISEPIAQISTKPAYSIPADLRGSTMPNDMARKLSYDPREIGNVAGMRKPPPQERTGKSYWETLSSTDHAMYAIGQTPVSLQHISEPIAQISTNAAYSFHADSRGSTKPHGMARKLSYDPRGIGNVAGMCKPPPQERTRKSYWETLNSTDHAMYAIGQTPVSLQHISEPIAQISTNAAYSFHADSRGSTMPHGMTRKLSYESRGIRNVPEVPSYKSWWDKKDYEAYETERRLRNVNTGAASSSTSANVLYYVSEYTATYYQYQEISNMEILTRFNGFKKQVEEELISNSRKNDFPDNQINNYFCKMCYKNNDIDLFLTHNLKFEDGRVQCPTLRALRCVLCNASGDQAHTIKYCPLNLR